ncbi:MAG: class I SAM-dependent methyltransferase [Rhodocyclaceae bacterium]|nr:class I SAM-dependent methyltransferase [Rhodocyclaceae bacterium]
MGWPEVERLFAGLPDILARDARLAVHGPFNPWREIHQRVMPPFDAWLKGQGAHQGLRDFEVVDALARKAGLVLARRPRYAFEQTAASSGAAVNGDRAACRSTCSIAPANCPTPTGSALPQAAIRSSAAPPRRRAEENRRCRHRTRLAGVAPGAARRCGPPGRVAAAHLREHPSAISRATGTGRWPGGRRGASITRSSSRRPIHAFAWSAPAGVRRRGCRLPRP